MNEAMIEFGYSEFQGSLVAVYVGTKHYQGILVGDADRDLVLWQEGSVGDSVHFIVTERITSLTVLEPSETMVEKIKSHLKWDQSSQDSSPSGQSLKPARFGGLTGHYNSDHGPSGPLKGPHSVDRVSPPVLIRE